MSETAVAGREVTALTLLSAAQEKGCDIQTIEAFAKLYREEREDERRCQFDAAMSAAQSEMQAVRADASNPQTRSKYASYAALDRALRPVYTKHGFALSFDTGESKVESCILVTCRVSHVGGHGRTHSIDMPADGKGAKGGDVMTKTHATGSAVSYGMRYLLKMIFNIAVGDDDGNSASGGGPKALTKQQVAVVKGLANQVAPETVKHMLQWAKVAKIEKITQDKFDAIIKALNKHVEQAKKSSENLPLEA